MAIEQAVASATDEHGLDGTALRADFPVFERLTRSGKRLVYLDAAASSPKPRAMIDALADAYAHHYANVHRGIYELSEDATARYEGARKRLARFIGAPSEREIVFVRNATEAINLVAHSWGRANLGPGDTILATEMEHHANLVPWQLIAQATGATISYVAIDEAGRLVLDDLERKLAGSDGRPAKLLAFSHVSNALGTINPVREIVERAHAVRALVMLDVAQSVPHMPVDVAALGADFVALSGHKMMGPSGIGALWARRELLDAMPPFLAGGSMISRVTLAGTTFAEVPWKFEAGTPAIAEAMGLAAAIEYLDGLGMQKVRQHERWLTQTAWDALGTIDGLHRYGPGNPDEQAGIISFTLDAIHPHDVATILDREGVAVRAGHHCAQPVMLHYGVPATTRASFYVYNDADDIAALIDAIGSTIRLFRG
ncbi:MAG: cysteine desulfurase [Chloroflexota bacterium]